MNNEPINMTASIERRIAALRDTPAIVMPDRPARRLPPRPRNRYRRRRTIR